VKLVAGLGNPGPRYADSRHNVGFAVVDDLARRCGIDLARYDRDFEALRGEGLCGGERVLLLKPQTFMNLSGRSVSAALRYYKLPLESLLVISDDLDLPVGQLRLRPSGSAGGQKGLADVIRCVGSDSFARLRLGIGKVHKAATVAHVLSGFTPDERSAVAEQIRLAAEAVECWVREGVTSAMNRYNRRKTSDED
jgi:PTH1 family peptidyl-tRNA hydrolase